MVDTKRYDMDNHSSWGSSINWYCYKSRRIHGHITPMIRAGDEVVSKMASGKHAVFRVVEVERMTNPTDQFFAKVEDVGYLEAS